MTRLPRPALSPMTGRHTLEVERDNRRLGTHGIRDVSRAGLSSALDAGSLRPVVKCCNGVGMLENETVSWKPLDPTADSAESPCEIITGWTISRNNSVTSACS